MPASGLTLKESRNREIFPGVPQNGCEPGSIRLRWRGLGSYFDEGCRLLEEVT